MASDAAGPGVHTIATSSGLAHLRPDEHRRCVGLVRPKRIDSRQVIRDVVAEQDRRALSLDIAEVGAMLGVADQCGQFWREESRHLWRIDQDRKSVVEGKSVSVRVDLGGRRIIKNKKQNETTEIATKRLTTHKKTQRKHVQTSYI